MAEESKVRLKFEKKPDTVPLSLVYFPNGPPSAAILNPEKGSSAITAYGSTKRSAQKMIVAETSSVEYVGKNFGSTAEKNSAHRYLVGVYEPAAKKMRLVEVDHAYPLEQAVKSLKQLAEKAKEERHVESEEAGDVPSLMEQKRVLIETFGSKKKQQQLRSAMANRVEEENITAASAVKKAIATRAAEIEETDPNKSLDPPDVAAHREVLPPFDHLATRREEVYPLDKLITAPEMESLDTNPIVALVKAEDEGAIDRERAQGSYSNYLLDCCKRLRGRSTKTIRQKGACLLYLDILLRFYRSSPVLKKKPAEIAQNLRASEVVTEKLLREFSQVQRNEKGFPEFLRSKLHKDKLLSYIFVLCLIIDDFELDISGICKELKLPTSQASLVFRECGCKTEQIKGAAAEDEEEGKSKSYKATLVAPITFPKPKKGKQN